MIIKTALILCAGFGKRLNPLTFSNPKPLLKFNDVTFLENTIILIEKLGIKKIILNTFHLKEKINIFLKEKKFNVSIDIVDDGEKILDTGGGIKNMINISNEKDFLVFNPDTIWNLNYVESITKMESYYMSNKIENILLVVNKKLSLDQRLKGDFNLNNSKIKKNHKNNFIFTGCQIIDRNLFKFTNKKKFSILEVWDNLIEKDNLYGFESKNEFLHIADLEIYEKLLKNQ